MSKNFNIPLHSSLRGISAIEYPFTVNAVIKRRTQLDSFLELPKDKKPPRSLWDKPSELEDWFDRVYDTKKDTSVDFSIDDSEIEG